MFVCICHRISDKQIKQAIQDGANTVCMLSDKLKVCTQCGQCETIVESLLAQAQSKPILNPSTRKPPAQKKIER